MTGSVRGEWYGDKIQGQVRAGVVSALQQTADEVILESRQMAPRDTNELAASAYTGVDPRTLIAIMGYDAARDIKSIKQHEDLTYRHPPGESAKFLEKPLKAARSRAGARIAQVLRGVFR